MLEKIGEMRKDAASGLVAYRFFPQLLDDLRQARPLDSNSLPCVDRRQRSVTFVGTSTQTDRKLLPTNSIQMVPLLDPQHSLEASQTKALNKLLPISFAPVRQPFLYPL